jgi:hypothetical protein
MVPADALRCPESPHWKWTQLRSEGRAFVFLPSPETILQRRERDQDAARKVDTFQPTGMIPRELCPTANGAWRPVEAFGSFGDGKQNGVEVIGHGSPLTARVWPCRRFVGEPPEARVTTYSAHSNLSTPYLSTT